MESQEISNPSLEASKANSDLILEVKTTSVSDFFKNTSSVSLPDYQRPYVWDEEKLKQLIYDLKEHFYLDNEFNEEAAHYYMGGILIHNKNLQETEIIDGQQRITSLLILNHAWKKSESILSKKNWKLEYNSMLSTKRIKLNYTFLKENESHLINNDLDAIFSKLVFTVIITNSQDEAFTFFDSQNSRGVTLSAVDFLKSYHLRELKKDEDLQRIFAKQWDKNNRGQFLNELFNSILWRARTWKGKSLFFENKDAILHDFQKLTIKEKENDQIKLYPNVFNSLAYQLKFDAENGVVIQPNSLNLQTTASQYPFAIRQPIQKGVGFFLYTEKYFEIYNILFKEKKYDYFSKVYNELVMYNSYYLRVLFKTASVFYYDKFKDNKLLDFALWMDYLLGSYRINQNSIVSQTIIKILRDKDQNLLDVIEMAYRPEDVFVFIRKITSFSDYGKDLSNDSDTGVRNNYKRANLTFYKNYTGNNKNLTAKKNWINDYINK